MSVKLVAMGANAVAFAMLPLWPTDEVDLFYGHMSREKAC